MEDDGLPRAGFVARHGHGMLNVRELHGPSGLLRILLEEFTIAFNKETGVVTTCNNGRNLLLR